MDTVVGIHFQEKAAVYKRLGLAVWLLLVATLAVAIWQQDRFFVVDIPPVAILEAEVGGTVARAEGVVRWRDLAAKDGLYDGDMVATGEDGRAKIKLGASRTLTLAENTQIKITAISAGKRDLSFLIRLVRGTASGEVSADCPNCGPIIIRAGDETFRVISGKALGLVKEAGSKPVRKFQPSAKDWSMAPVVRTDKSMVVGANFAQPVVAPAPVALPPPVRMVAKSAPVVVEAPKTPLLSQAMEAVVEPPADGVEYWTMEPASSLRSKGIAYPVTLPEARPPRGTWRPRFEVTDAKGQRADEVPISGLADKSLYVGLDRALRAASIQTRSGIKEYAFGLRGGAEVVNGKERGQSMASKNVLTKVYSLAEAPDGPVSIGLDQMTAAVPDPATHWLRPKQLIDVAAAGVAIHLVSSDDYPKLAPYIRGAAKIGLSRQGLQSPTGLFLVRKQAVIGQLTGAQVNKAVMDKVMAALGADFIFKGARSALHDVRATSQAALTDTIGALLDKGKVLYLLKRNKIYPVSRDFIKTSSEVAAFVDTQAMAIFLESVEIVDSH